MCQNTLCMCLCVGYKFLCNFLYSSRISSLTSYKNIQGVAYTEIFCMFVSVYVLCFVYTILFFFFFFILFMFFYVHNYVIFQTSANMFILIPIKVIIVINIIVISIKLEIIRIWKFLNVWVCFKIPYSYLNALWVCIEWAS